MVTKQLPLPSQYDWQKVGQVFHLPYFDLQVAAEAWATQYKIKPAATDTIRVCLMPIDVQNTFCTPGFELVVDGAVGDSRRIAEFIYRNMPVITKIRPTMDTHTAMQIFHPIFWVDANGNHPTPGTMISVDDVEKGKWAVNPGVAHSIADGNFRGLQMHALHYVRELAKTGKYALMIWPYHAMLGSIGHALVPAVEQACFFHNIARRSQTGFQIKGGNPLTENYSVLRPEVLVGPNGETIAQKNAQFIKELLESDIVIIAGQAKSHCVAWTIADLLDEIMAQDPKLVQKVWLLEDCTSPVVIPGVVDFTSDANAAFQRFAKAGMHVVKSTDPIENWGIKAPVVTTR